jgi:hypothetical protein
VRRRVHVAVHELEARRHETFGVRRSLADSVLIAGVASLVGGGALLVPSGDDQAWRFAGVNTAIFGAINTIVGLLALHGIGKEENAWEADDARAARRTADGLERARRHAIVDERRESVGHAINLGLDCAYLGVAGTAIVASQAGVDHPNRWLASGVAIGVQALFLVVIDWVGLARSANDHRAFVEPSISISPNAFRVGFGLAF